VNLVLTAALMRFPLPVPHQIIQNAIACHCSHFMFGCIIILDDILMLNLILMFIQAPRHKSQTLKCSGSTGTREVQVCSGLQDQGAEEADRAQGGADC